MHEGYQHWFCCWVCLLLIVRLADAMVLPARNVAPSAGIVVPATSTTPRMQDHEDQEEDDSNEIKSGDVYHGIEPSDQEIGYFRAAIDEPELTTPNPDARTSDDARSPQAIVGITVAVLVIVGVTLRVYCVRRKSGGADYSRTIDLGRV